MKILIVGAGIGGLSLAGFLEKEGISYKIVEKQKDQSHHGFSLGMWSNGRRVLSKLGIEENFDKAGAPLKKLKICNGKGKLLFSYNLSSLCAKYGGYLHIRRSELIDWLTGILPKGKVNFGISIEKIEEESGGMKVTFSDGSLEMFDLVVGADGMSSKVRELAFGGDFRKYTNWRAWYMWIDKKFVEPHSVIKYLEPNAYLVTFDERDRALAVFVAHEDHALWDKEDGRIEHLENLFKGEVKVVPDIFDNHESGELMPTDLSEVRMKTTYKNGVVLLGDAAHGFEPFAGIGGAMALEDSYILAGELFKQKDLLTALSNYSNKRVKRVEEARKITRRMMAWATISNRFMRRIVNFALPFIPNSLFIKSYSKLFNEEL